MWSLRTTLVRFIRAKPKDPCLRNLLNPPLLPAPGLDMKLPAWTVDQFFKKIGGDTAEYAEKFEKLEQVFAANRYQMKERGVPPKKRRYIKRVVEMMRRGVISFESLEKRTAVSVVKEKAPKVPVKGGKKGGDKKPGDAKAAPAGTPPAGKGKSPSPAQKK